MISEPTNSLEKERTRRERERAILLGERALHIEDMTWRTHFQCGTFWKKNVGLFIKFLKIFKFKKLKNFKN